jgi:hypothetical protein
MPDQRRAQKTTDKTRGGRLPAPTEYLRQVGFGDGRLCDGCGETIHPKEILYKVSILGGLYWGLHAVCYQAWAKFKPQ